MLSIRSLFHAGVPRFSHEGPVESIAWSMDGALIAACDPRWTTLWDPVSGERRWTVAPGGHATWLGSETLLVSGHGNHPFFYDPATAAIIGQLPLHATHVVALPDSFAAYVTLEHAPFGGVVRVDGAGEIIAGTGKPGGRPLMDRFMSGTLTRITDDETQGKVQHAGI